MNSGANQPYVVLTIFLLFSHLSAQDFPPAARADWIELFVQGFSPRAMGAFGIENQTIATRSTLAQQNPALLISIDSAAIGVSFQHSPDDNPFKEPISRDLKIETLRNFVPPSAILAFPLAFGAGAFSFSERYASLLNYGRFAITPRGQPDAATEYYDLVNQTIIYALSAAFAFPLRGFGPERGRLSLGMRGNLNVLHESLQFFETDDTADAKAYSVEIGLHFQRSDLSASISYTPAITFDGSKTYLAVDDTGKNLDSSGSIADRILFSINAGGSPFTSRYPGELKAGLLVMTADQQGASLNLRVNDWPGSSSFSWGLASSFISGLGGDRMGSIGLYFDHRRHILESEESLLTDEINALFLSAGLLLPLGQFDIEVSVADSHLTGPETRKQFFARLGLGFNLAVIP